MHRFENKKKNVLNTGLLQFRMSHMPCCVKRSFKSAPPNMDATMLVFAAIFFVCGGAGLF
jgi:hypothetical protein